MAGQHLKSTIGNLAVPAPGLIRSSFTKIDTTATPMRGSAAVALLLAAVASRCLAVDPISHPTSRPTALPTMAPFAAPATLASTPPTLDLTLTPTLAPTLAPTLVPTLRLTSQNSQPVVQTTPSPTAAPTSSPTTAPVLHTTPSPTAAPVSQTTTQPTARPTARPSVQPVNAGAGGEEDWVEDKCLWECDASEICRCRQQRCDCRPRAGEGAGADDGAADAPYADFMFLGELFGGAALLTVCTGVPRVRSV